MEREKFMSCHTYKDSKNNDIKVTTNLIINSLKPINQKAIVILLASL